MAWRTTTWWKRCYEGLRGAGVVSPFLRIFTGQIWVGFVVVVFVCAVCFCLDLAGETPALNYCFTSFANSS